MTGGTIIITLNGEECKPPRAPYDALVLIGRIDWCYACGKPKEKKDANNLEVRT